MTDIVKRLRNDYHILKNDYDALREAATEIERLRTDYHILKNDYDALRADNEQLRADVATLSRALNGLAKQLDYADTVLNIAHAQENDALENRP